MEKYLINLEIITNYLYENSSLWASFKVILQKASGQSITPKIDPIIRFRILPG
jgi:hypothetical protein